MERQVYVDPITSYTNRHEMGLTPRQALISGAKDRIRENWAFYRTTHNTRGFILYCLEAEIHVLKRRGDSAEFWQTTETELGNERHLTKLGRYIHSIIHYYKNITDPSLERLISDVQGRLE